MRFRQNPSLDMPALREGLPYTLNMYLRMYVCIYVSMYLCTYVYIYTQVRWCSGAPAPVYIGAATAKIFRNPLIS